MPTRIEIMFRGLRLIALGVEYEPATLKGPGNATWDMLYIYSDTGKNDITPLLGYVVKDSLTDLLVEHFEETSQ